MREDPELPAWLPGFQPLLRHWILERTIAWLRRIRRTNKDYEFPAATTEAWAYLSMVRVMIERLAHEEVEPATFHYRSVG